MGLNGSRFALWSKTGGRTDFFLCQVLTCFLFHQPDINWLWPLQVVYGKTDLRRPNKCTLTLCKVILGLKWAEESVQ